MKIQNNLRIIAALLILVEIGTTGCKKMVSAEMPDDRITTETVFANDAGALSAMSGVYATMIQANQQFGSGGITIMAGLSADELSTTSTATNLLEFADNELTPGNTMVRSNLWVNAYQLIFMVNNIIEGLSNSKGVTTGVKQQLTGEAMFIRAFCYFYLVNLFGDVPLVLNTDYRQNAAIPRTPLVQVYDQIVSDLQSAKSYMAEVYPAPGRVRPNRHTAAALLARVYLLKQDWAKAESEASSVIGASHYFLNPNPANVFLQGSAETIWQLAPVSAGINTWDGNNFIPTGNVVPQYPLANSLAAAFSANDLRKIWTKTVTVGANTYAYPYKYKVKTSSTITEYYVVFRLAEQYLLRAEARAKQNKVAIAQADLNIIRTRAGLTNTGTGDTALLLTEIEQERRIELFTEWGHRWFDLKRTGRAQVMLNSKPGWQPTDILYPIPLTEIQRNPALHQNPGY